MGKWQHGHYDLVLMDCQMPVIDGYQATRTIRAEESSGHIPIIALTANAFADNHQRCLDAGMDDFIAKPFELVRLREVLDRWLLASPAAPVAITFLGGDVAVDGDALQQLRDTLWEDFAEFLDAFHISAEEILQALPAAQAAKDLQTIERLAHSLKSAARNACAGPLATLAEQLEQLAHSGDESDHSEHIRAMAQEYARVRDALQAIVAA